MSKIKTKTDLDERMKRYEAVPKNFLMRRTPVIIRLDGRAFHTFTKGMKKPFDEILVRTMQETMRYLCENIQGCVLGYTQSDEITLVLTDYEKLETDAWFGYNQQKLVSVAASMATMAFNNHFNVEIFEHMLLAEETQSEEMYNYANLLMQKKGKAMFDARAFNVPVEEVTNCVLWRQNDAVRNSVEALAQAHFSQNELQHKSNTEAKAMLLEKGIDWNELPIHLQRGSCCIKRAEGGTDADCNSDHMDHADAWFVDLSIPVFKLEGREYIESRIT